MRLIGLAFSAIGFVLTAIVWVFARNLATADVRLMFGVVFR